MINKSASLPIEDDVCTSCLKADQKLRISLVNEIDMSFLYKSTNTKAVSNKSVSFKFCKVVGCKTLKLETI